MIYSSVNTQTDSLYRAKWIQGRSMVGGRGWGATTAVSTAGSLSYTSLMSEPQSVYVLTTDARMPSKSNLWGTQVARSPKDASAQFKEKIQQFHSTDGLAHLRVMEKDRARRLREDDFSVELA
jgi:hypothetical protein